MIQPFGGESRLGICGAKAAAAADFRVLNGAI